MSEAAPLACPSCGGVLDPALDGSHVCAECYGLWRPSLTVEGLRPVAAEDRLADTLRCPLCDAAMTPWQIGEDRHAVIHRCPSCEQDFVGNTERRALERHEKRARARAMYNKLDEEERAQLAGALANTTLDPREPSIYGSKAGVLFRLMGIPQVHYTRVRMPLVTPLFAVALLVMHFVVDADAWSYRANTDSFLQAIRSVFVHADGLHLAGNLYFLLVFGIGAEAKMPRLIYATWLLLGGVLGALVHGMLYPDVAVLGASGLVAVAMGLCFVLQRHTPVTLPILYLPLKIPMIAFGALEVVYQVGSAAAGVEGIAWSAHLVGLAVGIGLGLVAGDDERETSDS